MGRTVCACVRHNCDKIAHSALFFAIVRGSFKCQSCRYCDRLLFLSFCRVFLSVPTFMWNASLNARPRALNVGFYPTLAHSLTEASSPFLKRQRRFCINSTKMTKLPCNSPVFTHFFILARWSCVLINFCSRRHPDPCIWTIQVLWANSKETVSGEHFQHFAMLWSCFTTSAIDVV